jgi:hypothetical protein
MTHMFVTDVGDVALSEAFVAEAESRWPGSVTRREFVWHGPDESESIGWREPKWVTEVHGAITQLAIAALAGNTRINTIKTLSALGLS